MYRLVHPLRCSSRTPAFLILPAAALAVFLFWSPAKAPAAPNTSALIAEAMDHQFEIELNDPLQEALDKIGGKTGVTIKPDPVIWDLLPWGEQTTVTAKFKNVTLRQALTALTRKYGLIYSLGEDAVILKPMPALRRLGRRATLQELDGLATLATTDMPKVPDDRTVRGMLAVVDSRLDAIKPPLAYAIEDRLPNELRDKPLDVPRNATLMDAMELLVKQTPASWYPWGKYMVVVPKPTLIRDHLNKTFTVKYTNTDIQQVLEDLRRQAAVDFIIDPGAIQRVPAEFRTVRVYWENVTVEQALESLKGLTGLQYSVTDDGVKITNALPASAGTGGGNSDPAVALLTIDNGIQVMLRRSDVPPDVQAYLKYRADKAVERLRESMKKEGFQPDPSTLTPPAAATTAPPATQPTTPGAATGAPNGGKGKP